MRASRLLGSGSFGAFLIAGHLLVSCGDDADKAPDGSGGSGGSATAGGTKGGGDAGDDEPGNVGGGGTGSDEEPSAGTGGAGEPTNQAGASNAGAGGGGDVDQCSLPWSEPPPPSDCDLDALEDGGTIPRAIDSGTHTLKSGHSYRLDGPTRVGPGATIKIEPCVKILGQSEQSVLAIAAGDVGSNGKPGPGGKIEAVGEPDAPIVFTSRRPAGTRLAGDWGGVIILGNARVNRATELARPSIEGLVNAEPYGWHTDEFNAESSGSLAYVRIEYVGFDIDSAGNETNGLTLGGVGSGTTIHHVMVSNSIDDCFEWFGGTVNASYLVANNCDDDMFDTDYGFTGTVQFAFGRQFQTSMETDSNGFEMDNNADDFDAEPRTAANWSNVTLCGTEREVGVSSPRIGMVLRRGLGGSIQNALVTGFDSAAFSVREAETSVTLTHSVQFSNALLFDSAHAKGADWFSRQEGNSSTRPGFCNCWADVPVPFPRSRIAGGTPDGFPDSAASYVGAFEDASPESNWMNGAWVDWSEE